MTVGWPAEDPAVRDRLPLADAAGSSGIVHFEKYMLQQISLLKHGYVCDHVGPEFGMSKWTCSCGQQLLINGLVRRSMQVSLAVR